MRVWHTYSGTVERCVALFGTNNYAAPSFYIFEHDELVRWKNWVDTNGPSFLRSVSSNGPVFWTTASLLTDSGAPSNYLLRTPWQQLNGGGYALTSSWCAAGYSELDYGFKYVTNIMARLTKTWITGGCNTNCGRTGDMGVYSTNWSSSADVCTNYPAWSFVGSDACDLPYAASVVADTRVYADEISIVYTLGYTLGPGCEPFYEIGVFTDKWAGCISDPEPAWVPFITNGFFGCRTNEASDSVRRVEEWTTNRVVCSGGLNLCLTRSSNPIGYTVPTTNIASARVEYLAAGLPAGCSPSIYSNEAISAALLNGLWILKASNATSAARYWCDTDFVSTDAPFGACTTNAGWAVTNAGAALIWDFQYR